MKLLESTRSNTEHLVGCDGTGREKKPSLFHPNIDPFFSATTSNWRCVFASFSTPPFPHGMWCVNVYCAWKVKRTDEIPPLA